MRKIFAAVFGLLFFISSTCYAYAPEGRLIVTMLNVGQGDSFLIETPTQNVLIDTGDLEEREQLLAELGKVGVTRFERIILTHPHIDHIGGVRAVLDNYPVDEIIDNGVISANPLYLDYRTADVKFSNFKSGTVIDFGGGVKFKILSPISTTVRAVNSKSRKSNPNNESIVGRLSFGDFSMLFTGDIEKKMEEELTERATFDLQSTILKAPHHGSRTSSSEDFVFLVKPKLVFISAGANNKHHHPHNLPLEVYRMNFVLPENIFCTAFNGTVKVETDGTNYIVLPEIFSDWVEDYTGEIITVTRLD